MNDGALSGAGVHFARATDALRAIAHDSKSHTMAAGFGVKTLTVILARQHERGDRRRRGRATRKQQIHPVFALFEPDRAIERSERQTCSGVHRPDKGDPTHSTDRGWWCSPSSSDF